MFMYGSDKPDLRVPWKFEEFSDMFDKKRAFGFVVRKTEGELPSVNNLKRSFTRLYPDSMYKVRFESYFGISEIILRFQNLRFFKKDGNSFILGDERINNELNRRFDLGDGDLLTIIIDDDK